MVEIKAFCQYPEARVTFMTKTEQVPFVSVLNIIRIEKIYSIVIEQVSRCFHMLGTGIKDCI